MRKDVKFYLGQLPCFPCRDKEFSGGEYPPAEGKLHSDRAQNEPGSLDNQVSVCVGAPHFKVSIPHGRRAVIISCSRSSIHYVLLISYS